MSTERRCLAGATASGAVSLLVLAAICATISSGHAAFADVPETEVDDCSSLVLDNGGAADLRHEL